MKVFGCLCFATNPSISADKFSHKGVPCVFIGYPPLKKGFKLLNLLTNKEFISRDVVFHETIFPFHKDSVKSFMNTMPPSFPSVTPIMNSDDWIMEPSESSENADEVDDNTSEELDDNESEPEPQSSDSPAPIIRKSTRTPRNPAWMQDFVLPSNISSISNLATTIIEPQFHCFMTNIAKTHDPTSFKEAVKCAH